MRHLLIAASLLLASLLLVQVVVAAFQDSATRGHEVSDNFVPGELPRSALPAVLGPGMRARVGNAERARPGRPLDYRHPLAPEPLDTQSQQPAAQEQEPSQAPSHEPNPAAPGSLKLPAPVIQNTAPPGADRA